LANRDTHSTPAPALEALRINVIVARARVRLSQEQLALRAGVSRPTISRIERASGDVGVEVVQRIADALGTTVSDLFVCEGEDNPSEDEILRRASAPASEFVDARAFLAALDEADGRTAGVEMERYSRAGRPPLSR
jgi:putative molybdopterin biosynthesis protein